MVQEFKRVPHVQPRSPVTAANTSAATRELEQRTNSMQDQLSAIAAGQLLQLEDCKLESAVLAGSTVYWNAATNQFELAMADVAQDPTTGFYVPSASSEVVGICMRKTDSTTGTVVFAGLVDLPPSAVLVMFGGSAPPGRYYLSGRVAGTLVRQQPSVSVSVAMLLGPADDCETSSRVLVLPQTRNFMQEHVHLQFELTAAPAGESDPPGFDSPHVITSPDPGLPGWLPASHAVFGGLAPAGAVFGYNISADPDLSSAWPPLPAASATLEILVPQSSGLRTITGLMRITPDFVRIDAAGIWWLSDCYNQVPWPWGLASSSSSSAAGDGCPVVPGMRLILSFVRMLGITDKTVVTSLQAGADEPLEFVDARGLAATTGDLYAKLSLSLLISPTEAIGGQVLKGVETARFTKGWVTEGIISLSSAVTLTSTRSRARNPLLPVSVSNPEVHQGLVSVDFVSDSTTRELQPQLTRLIDTLEREVRGVLCVGFPASRTSSAKYSFHVPTVGLPDGDLLMQLRVVVMGTVIGPLPAMTVVYSKVPRPVDGDLMTISAATTSVVFDITTPSDDVDGSGGNLPTFTPIEVVSAALSVDPGDTIFVTLQRAADSAPAFNADVNILRITGLIYKDV